jgi:cell division protein FtsL
MHNRIKIAMAVILLCLISAVFSVSNKVQKSEKKLVRLENKIEDEHESLRVLQAEWTFLNSPERLEKLARNFFGLVPSEGSQYLAIAALPMRATLDAQQAENIDIEALANIEPGTQQNLDKTDAVESKKSPQIIRVTGEGIGAYLPPAPTKQLADIIPVVATNEQVVR